MPSPIARYTLTRRRSAQRQPPPPAPPPRRPATVRPRQRTQAAAWGMMRARTAVNGCLVPGTSGYWHRAAPLPAHAIRRVAAACAATLALVHACHRYRRQPPQPARSAAGRVRSSVSAARSSPTEYSARSPGVPTDHPAPAPVSLTTQCAQRRAAHLSLSSAVSRHPPRRLPQVRRRRPQPAICRYVRARVFTRRQPARRRRQRLAAMSSASAVGVVLGGTLRRRAPRGASALSRALMGRSPIRCIA